jgi:glycosyltransferase involved in cell wall biosynthesis
MPISIVMPTYNGLKYVKQAVTSVLSQTHSDWKLIISDDGSKDGTRRFLEEIRDPRVIVHFQPANLNIFGNLNFLFAQANGEITQILCQDDYLIDEHALQRLSTEWSKLPREVVFLRSNHSADTNSRLSAYESVVLPAIVTPEQSDLLFFIFGCIPGNLSNVSVRTEAVKAAGWFRPELPYAGDFDLWSRVGHSHSWAITKAKVSQIRSHEEQASGSLNRSGELLAQLRFILSSLYESLAEKGHSTARLKLMATIAYVSQHRDRGVKDVLRGRGSTYLRAVSRDFDSANFSFGSFLGWLVYFASLGGRAFRRSAANQLLREKPLQKV